MSTAAEKTPPTEKAPPAERLAVLEAIFEKCMVPWWKGWQALGEILRDKLWKTAGHKTEKDYLRKRWNIGLSQGYRKAQMAKLAEELGEGLPDDVRESHLASLAGYPPDLQRQILDVATKTAPGGKLTAGWIEQTARRLVAERLAALKDGQPAAVEEDEEDDPEGNAADPKPPESSTKGGKGAGKGSGKSGGKKSTTEAAESHPITQEEEIKKRVNRVYRLHAKWEREALAFNMTPEDLFEQVRELPKAEFLQRCLQT